MASPIDMLVNRKGIYRMSSRAAGERASQDCPRCRSQAGGGSLPCDRPARQSLSFLSRSWSKYHSSLFFLHQRQEYLFQAGLAPVHFLDLRACIHQHTNERADVALAMQFDEQMIALEFGMGDLWPRTHHSQRLLSEAAPNNLC